jgi:branched-subunit amino acid aminotransferase/4-amino-4-deoxychorismate lyase
VVGSTEAGARPGAADADARPRRPRVCWVDGRLEPLERPVVRADDSAFTEGRGCYTSTRVVAGRPRFAERHVARLVHAARELRLPPLDPELARRALFELAQAAFGAGDGVVRVQVTRDGDGALHVFGVPRALGFEPAEWSAVVVRLPHAAAGLASGLKVASRLGMALAGDAAREAGADEALLVDAAGRLLEGSRSNVVVVPAQGPPATPPASDGAVAGVARSLALERVPELSERSLRERDLRAAREVVALNAVRGARPITRLDGERVGDGRPGPWAERLAAALARD